MDQNDNYGVDDPLVIVIKHLIKGDQEELAEKVIDAFANAANHIETVNCISKLYYDVRSYNKAEKFSLKTLDMCESNEQKYNVRSNLGKMYNNFNEPVKSLFYSKQNFAIKPNNPDTLLEMVFSYFLNGQKEPAEKILRELKANEHLLDERHRNIVNFNLGTYDMEAGHFLKGLGGFLINVKKLDLWFNNAEVDHLKYWQGGAYPGKNLVMYMSGGGIGDSWIAVRWLQDLKKLGFNPMYCVDNQDVCDVLNNCGYTAIRNLDGLDPENTMWTFALETPLWLQPKVEQVRRENYLWASDKAKEKWSWLKERKKIKVGVRFIGNKKNNALLYRHIELHDMMDFLHDSFDGYDVEYYSLQKGDGEDEVKTCPELIDIADQITSFDDTFALLENLDLVVTTCTSVLHASAIVGTKTIGFVPIAAYFTYLSPTTEGRPPNTSIWYGDNLRFFRQVKPKSWKDPMIEAKSYIKQYMIENYNE